MSWGVRAKDAFCLSDLKQQQQQPFFFHLTSVSALLLVPSSPFVSESSCPLVLFVFFLCDRNKPHTEAESAMDPDKPLDALAPLARRGRGRGRGGAGAPAPASAGGKSKPKAKANKGTNKAANGAATGGAGGAGRGRGKAARGGRVGTGAVPKLTVTVNNPAALSTRGRGRGRGAGGMAAGRVGRGGRGGLVGINRAQANAMMVRQWADGRREREG